MNIQVLIDSIVRQTTILIAQLATSAGARAPLAHIANQVFLESLPESIQPLSVDAGKVARREFIAAYRDALCLLQQASANRPVGCP